MFSLIGWSAFTCPVTVHARLRLHFTGHFHYRFTLQGQRIALHFFLPFFFSSKPFSSGTHVLPTRQKTLYLRYPSLTTLLQGWQKKLSQQQLASFPWDPKPEPPPAPAAPAPQPTPTAEPAPQAPSNGVSYSQQNQQHAPPAQGLTMPTPGGQSPNDPRIKPEPSVKIEPGLESTPMIPLANQHQSGHQGGGQAVQQRVIQQLQSQYGDRAAASISKLKEQPQNGNQPPNQQRPAQPMPQGYPRQYQGNPQQQYRPTMAPGQQQRPPMPNGQRQNPSQMDGAGDSADHAGVLLYRGPNGETTWMAQVDIDRLLHDQIVAKAKAMEGGGLMVPLRRAGKGKAVPHHRASAADGPSRFDGGDDEIKDESDDEDAINSDLDDPDDNLDEDDEDEDGGQIMLCMYDKVQRVKNKWKCVLKDGLLSVNGKDYVFHKATGEYEW
ncbi:transcription factor IIA, alpha/beta subunit [Xylariaceae sp. FL0662B]|nr:transcription factor IIA, alpha/beta subunit [Xylariaceae sp. FL0662B]